jgi:hypothetical protein
MPRVARFGWRIMEFIGYSLLGFSTMDEDYGPLRINARVLPGIFDGYPLFFKISP